MKNIRQKFLENSSSNQKLFLTRSRIFFLLLFFCSVSLMAQNGVVVKGKVLDANDEPLIGAAIVLKGNTNVGTVADFDGNFTLEVPNRNSVLTVSYLGMTPQDVKVNGRTMIVVVLREDTEVLDEVVVVGYGQQKKASVVGAITQTSSKVLERAGGVSDLGSALTGHLLWGERCSAGHQGESHLADGALLHPYHGRNLPLAHRTLHGEQAHAHPLRLADDGDMVPLHRHCQ
jgi:hypothetical protein